jgi:flagellar biosynthesis/type III secretory pathway chaperone
MIASKPSALANGHVDPLTEQLARLGILLDQETALLGSGTATEMMTFIQKKSMILLQLDLPQFLSRRDISPKLQQELTEVRDKLARNRTALQLNIRALQELNELLAERHRDAESDGTYSMFRR